MICFPKIYARSADTDLSGNVGNGQSTVNSSVTKVTAKAWFAGHVNASFSTVGVVSPRWLIYVKQNVWASWLHVSWPEWVFEVWIFAPAFREPISAL